MTRKQIRLLLNSISSQIKCAQLANRKETTLSLPRVDGLNLNQTEVKNLFQKSFGYSPEMSKFEVLDSTVLVTVKLR